MPLVSCGLTLKTSKLLIAVILLVEWDSSMSKQSRARVAAASRQAARCASPSHEPKTFIARWGTLLAGVIIMLAALIAYHNSLSGPFILDDDSAITSNPSIKHFGSALSPPSDLTAGGRPLLNLTFAVNYALGGMDVSGYHAVNLLIHTLAALTLFGLVRRTLLKPPLTRRFGAVALPLALAVAVIWVVHPLQTEAVTYISERAESLMGLFYLLTLYCFIRGTESATPARWQILSIMASLLGVLSKEIIVTSPVIIFLYDRTFVAGSFREAWRRRWQYYLGLASTWLLLARLMTGLNQRGVGFDKGATWWSYALVSCRSVVFYLKLAIWPHPLVFDYGFNVVQNPAMVLPYVPILAVLLASTAIALWRWPPLGFVGAWFFVILAPSSSVIPLTEQPMAESRIYLSLAAVVGLVVLGLYTWIGRRSLIIFVAAAVGLGWLTIQRNKDYRSGLAIWSDTLAKRPDNSRAHNNLGLVLLKIPGRSPEAISHYEAALRINPDDAEAHNNLGEALANIPGQLPEAISHYETALRLNPDLAEAHSNLGNALAEIPGHLPNAIAEFEAALRIKPDYAEVHNNLGNALAEIPGHLPEAIAQCQAALRIKPDYAEAHYNLGTALSQIPGRLPEAIAEYQAALCIKPDFAEAYNNLGTALSQTPGRLPDAVVEFQTALRIKPDYAEVHNNLGIVLAKISGRLPDAISHFEAALKIKPDFAEAHKNLGIALATIPGRLPDAISQFEAVLRINPDYAEVHYDLGIELMKPPNRLHEAIQHFETALKLKPSYADAQNCLVICLAKSGRIAEAISHFEAALEIEPNFAKAHVNLGKALAYVGRPHEAEQHFKTALKLDPDIEEARQQLERLEQH
jgi:tetratricopeptide (TPR) repeat protein